MELKTLAILGSSGFIGGRLFEKFNSKFKIVKIKRNLELKKKLKIDYLICCSGPNKYWCEENKKYIIHFSENFAKKIIKFCEKNKVKKLIYFSSIQVLKKNNKQLISYIKWHMNIEKNLKNSFIKKVIIRLPNLFGRPKKNKKYFWNFFINSIIKNSFLKRKIYIQNKPNQKIFAMPINYFLKILEIHIHAKYLSTTKVINVNKYYKFRTDELMQIMSKILQRNNILLKLKSNDKYLRKFVFKNHLSPKKYFFFKEEMQSLIKFAKTKF
jgi:nucleoside-diphosphate-sugar epimerase